MRGERHDWHPARWPTLVGCLVIVVAVAVAYRNTPGHPLVFDDNSSLLRNPSLNSLAASLNPPNNEGITVAGRPVLNFSFAVNRALSGENFAAYRVTNIAIHICAALVLLLALQRALHLAIPDRETGWLAASVALLWALHPLNTESVTYLVQRAESLSGLFYFLSLLGFLLFVGEGSRAWSVGLSVAACFLGVATKETVATAPLLMLLFDRAFVAGSFASALKARWKFYAAAACSWIVLGLLVAGTDGRSATAGYDSGASTWQYLVTQSSALLTYIKLTFVPAPLVFDYGAEMAGGVGEVLPQFVVCVALVAGAGYLVMRNTALGFLAGAYLLVLAPTTSVIPVATQAMAEHRTYPALVFLLLLVAIPLWRALHTWALCLLLPVAILFGWLTYQRNADYATVRGLWEDTIAKRPTNARAFFGMGGLLLDEGRTTEALAAFRQAVNLKQGSNDVELNVLGRVLLDTGDFKGAAEAFRAAMNIEPREVYYPSNLGTALFQLGETDAAMECYRQALAIDPQHGGTLYNLANLLMAKGRKDEAMQLYQRAEAVVPNDPLLHMNYGMALGKIGDQANAGAHLELARKLSPKDPKILFAHGCHQAFIGKLAEASDSFLAAIAIDPNHLPAHGNLAEVYLLRGEKARAKEQYLEVLRIDPQNAIALQGLGRLEGR